MSQFRRVLPAEGLVRVEIKVWRGGLTIRGASAGATGVLECDGDLDFNLDGETLRCKQSGGLASLLGEQQVRIAIDGNVLLDKRLRFGTSNLTIALPASVRELLCDVGWGDIRLDGVDADVAFHIGTGSASVSNGRGRVAMKSDAGDAKVSAWQGSIQFTAGKGNFEAEGMDGEVQATVVTGDVKVGGAARVEAKTGYGDLTVDGTCVEAVLKSGKGHIVGTNLMGARLDVRTGQGEIALSGQLAGLKAETGCGEILCRCALALGDYELKSGRGDLSLDLPEGIGARIDASARHGRIESDLPLITVGTPGPEGYFGKRVVGSIGGGPPQATVLLRTDHGDIRLFRRPRREEAIPSAQLAGREEDRERIVLEAVSQGDLTVDEALVLLTESPRV